MKKSLICKCQALFATHSNKKNTTYFNGLLALFLMVMGMGGSWGQTTIASQDFESSPGTPTLSFSNTYGANSTGTNGASGLPANANLFVSGSRGWQSVNTTSTLTFANQSLSGYTNAFIDFRLAGMSLNSGNGIDGADLITVSISVDGGTTYSSELTIGGSSANRNWDFTASGTSTITYDGNNTPTAVTSATGSGGISTVKINIPNVHTQVRVRIAMLTNDSNERYVIDDVRVRGTVPTSTTYTTSWSNGAPTSTIDAIIDGDLTTSTDLACKDLTINASRILTISSANRLTVNGTLTNNGTLTLESGATLVQGAGNTVAGSGTFNVKQALTGAGGATPSGRFWYLGSPVSTANSGVFNAAGNNRLWTYSETALGYNTEINDNATPLLAMQGAVVRLGANDTIVFTGGLLNTGNYTSSLTRTGTTNTKRGYHLLSNPYPSYLDWSAAYAGATGISSTIWYRSYNTTNTTMVFDTYNTSTGSVAVTNSGGTTTQYIPPMQSFWVYNPTDGTTGSITFSNSMRSHQANGGLKDIEDFPAFARLNLVDGDFIDQVVVYTEPNAKNKIDNYDSKKFLLPNKPQVYATVGDEQLVINGLKSGMAKTIVPLTVELPNAQVYTFEMNESYVENGSVILEDTQEGVFQDMGIHTTYQFSSDAGVIANRFVLHFLLPTGNTSDSEDSQVGINDLTNAQIDVINNQQGSILVSISSDLQASGEIQILDAAGSLIQSKTISDHTTALAIKQGAGIYFVRVITPLKSEMKKIFIY